MSKYSEELKATLAREAEEKNKQTNQKFTRDELLKKFFVPVVPKGQTSAKFNIRLIPPPEGQQNPMVKENKVNFHNIEYYKKWTKYLCLKEDGKECPFCDTHEALKAKYGSAPTDEQKKEMMRYRSQPYYIFKLIERGKEADGPKFWRFKQNFKQTGEWDKLKSLIDNDYEIFDTSDEGFDLTIDCGMDGAEGKKKNSVVKTILAAKKTTPLSDDEEEVEAWVNDDSTWRDLFKVKPASELEDIIFGRAKYWDNSLNKYITPNSDIPVADEKKEAKPVDSKTLVDTEGKDPDSLDLDDDSDDLPF